jgi:hypothetical protein
MKPLLIAPILLLSLSATAQSGLDLSREEIFIKVCQAISSTKSVQKSKVITEDGKRTFLHIQALKGYFQGQYREKTETHIMAIAPKDVLAGSGVTKSVYIKSILTTKEDTEVVFGYIFGQSPKGKKQEYKINIVLSPDGMDVGPVRKLK